MCGTSAAPAGEQTSGRHVTSAPTLLSAQLRLQTKSLHDQIEVQLALPGAIRSRDDYRLWLTRFLGLYEPLERLLAQFPEWDAFDFALPPRSQTSCLTDDLATLGVDPVLGMDPVLAARTPAALPDLPTFAHALGARYVVEGATLGGRLILRDIEARIGIPIAGATSFFGGRGDAVGAMWQRFRTTLDGFGHEQPKLCDDVITGAHRTFHAMLGWFAPFCAGLATRS